MSWIVRLPRIDAAVRLFCFPYAGGGASAFRDWPAGLPAEVEVCAIQSPGRESRLKEPPIRSLGALVEALVEETRRWRDRRFAFFGHSVGALVAFELARALRRRGEAMPIHLFASGSMAPHRTDVLADGPLLSALSDGELRERLRRFGGTPPAVLDHPELMELLLPALRADLGLRDGYACTAEAPLDLPITALFGHDDIEVPHGALAGWREQTRAEFRVLGFPGGHFFVRTALAPVLRAISDDLWPLWGGRRAS